MNKGIVMEMDASAIIVMTSEGKFAKIPLEKRNCQIGDEIAFTLVERKRAPWLKLSSFIAVAAVVLLLLFNVMSGFNMTANKQIVAYVSIDINPSVEMGIDENDIVLEIRGLNEDGVQLIRNLKFANKTVDALTEDLLQEAEKKYLSKGEGDIVISSTMGENASSSTKVNDVLLSSKLKVIAIQHIEKLHPEQKSNYQVTAFAAPKEVRKVANSKGLSTGKYSMYLNAKDKGQKTTIEDLKKESVHAIAKKSGGMNKLIQPEALSKEKISELLREDESGDLDRKLIKKQNDRKNEDKKNDEQKNENKKNEEQKNEEQTNEDKKNEDKKNEDKKKEDKRNEDKKNNEENKNDDKKNKDWKKEDSRGNNKESEWNFFDSQSFDNKNRLKDAKSQLDNNEFIFKPESTPISAPEPKTSYKRDREKENDKEKEKEHKHKSKDESDD
jgi:hypothetical protein